MAFPVFTSRSTRSRMPIEGRKQPRTPKRFLVQISAVHDPLLEELAAARLYQLAASKVRVRDYKKLVNKKLRTGERMYSFMVDQFHQGRAFALELIIIIILLLDLALVFLHKE